VLLILLPSWFSCASQLATHPVPSHYEEGFSNYQKGELLAAIQEWERVSAGHSRYQQAQEMIRVANGILNELVTVHLLYGSNLEKEGRLSEALQEYQRAFLLDSRRRDAEERIQKVQDIISPLVRYHLNLAQGLEENGQLPEALNELRLVQVFDPDNREAQERSVQIRERIELEVNSRYEAGLNYFQQGSYPAAGQAMEAVLSLKPDHEGGKRYREAIDKALQEEKKLGGKGSPPLNLGLKERRMRVHELIARGDWEQARKEANSLLEIDPHDAETKDLLAFAEARFREKVDTLFQKGIRYFQEEELDAAISVWRQVLTLDSGHKRAKEYLEKAELMREKIRRIKGGKVDPTL